MVHLSLSISSYEHIMTCSRPGDYDYAVFIQCSSLSFQFSRRFFCFWIIWK